MLFLVQVTYMLRYTLDSAKSKVATTPNLDSSAISLATLALPRTLSSENISDLTMLHSALHWHLQEDELIDEETNHKLKVRPWSAKSNNLSYFLILNIQMCMQVHGNIIYTKPVLVPWNDPNLICFCWNRPSLANFVSCWPIVHPWFISSPSTSDMDHSSPANHQMLPSSRKNFAVTSLLP